MKRICTICARAGSTRLKNKNIYLLHEAPLLAYSIAAARQSGVVDQVVITSESAEYREIGLAWGADFAVERPAELATSNISKTASIAHAVAEVEARTNARFDTIIDLDVTAPLRQRDDVANAVRQFDESGQTALISAVESKSTPYSNMFFRDADGCLEAMIPKGALQEHTGSARPCYALNASIYMWKRDDFMAAPATFFPKTLMFLMPAVTRYDVDTIDDLEYVDHLLKLGRHDFVRPIKP